MPDISFMGLFGDLFHDNRLRSTKQFNILRERRDRFEKNILEYISDRQHKLFLDKICFVLGIFLDFWHVKGVAWLWITAFIMGKYPYLMLLFSTLTVIPLVTLRYFLYRRVKHHFFLADLCYFVNLLMILLNFFRDSKVLLVSLFGLVNGPVAWAIYGKI